MQRALITGSAGFIGSALSRRLTEDGHGVIGIDDLRTGRSDRVNDAETFVNRDIGSLSDEDWLECLDGVDVVFHLAAEKYNSSKMTPQRILDSNVMATSRLFQIAANREIKVVFASSLYAYGSGHQRSECWSEDEVATPHTLYGSSKLFGENLLSSLRWSGGLEYSALRLFFIYGKNQYAEGGYKSVIVKTFENILDNRAPTIFGTGHQALDYVYLDDCLDAIVKSAINPINTVVNIASSSPIEIRDIIAKMVDVAGSRLSPEHEDADWTDGTYRGGSSARAKDLLGWESTTSIDSGLRAIWSDFRDRETRV